MKSVTQQSREQNLKAIHLNEALAGEVRESMAVLIKPIMLPMLQIRPSSCV
jgi:hypothetical protein